MAKFGIRRRRKDPIQFCLKCGRKYKTVRGYSTHLLTHAEVEFPFVCDEPGCGKKYKKESHFQSHGKRHSRVETKEKAIKALEASRKRRRKVHILKFPCMFCDFRTTSRSHAEKHMEVRHTERFKQNRHAIRAHASAITIQHDQMLLALEIEDSLNTKLLQKNSALSNDTTIIEKKGKSETLCAVCGRMFKFPSDFESHDCCETPFSPIGKAEGEDQVMTNVPQYNYLFIDNKEYSPYGRFPAPEYSVEGDWGPLDLSLNPNRKEVCACGQTKSDTTENLNGMNLFPTNISVDTSTPVDQQPVIFTFQDLLILEQNLTPIYL